jgi:hypothetical protein
MASDENEERAWDRLKRRIATGASVVFAVEWIHGLITGHTPSAEVTTICSIVFGGVFGADAIIRARRK